MNPPPALGSKLLSTLIRVVAALYRVQKQNQLSESATASFRVDREIVLKCVRYLIIEIMKNFFTPLQGGFISLKNCENTLFFSSYFISIFQIS